MALKIRLTRKGAKKNPRYRIMVADTRSPRDGGFIEQIGTYDPMALENKARFKEDRLKSWLSQGAIPTQTVSSLIKSAGLTGK